MLLMKFFWYFVVYKKIEIFLIESFYLLLFLELFIIIIILLKEWMIFMNMKDIEYYV